MPKNLFSHQGCFNRSAVCTLGIPPVLAAPAQWRLARVTRCPDERRVSRIRLKNVRARKKDWPAGCAAHLALRMEQAGLHRLCD